jgi:voltage-gated potassium channel
MLRRSRQHMADRRRRVYEILEQGVAGDRRGLIVFRLLILIILVNLAAVVLESVPSIQARYGAWFDVIEIGSLVIFTVEYGLRLWSAVEHPPYRHMSALRARWSYATSAAGLVDCLAVLPFWLAFVLPSELRVLMVLRIFRFLKIARYSPAIRSLLDALVRERRALFGCIVILVGTALMSGTLMYLAERNVQPDKLGTIPDSVWWAIVTLGTIGYGDVVPITTVGKMIATVTIFLGLVMVALPIGIIANAFADEIHRRDFVVTWGMVARVPLFAGLTAAEIANIMRLLRSQQVEPGGLIARRGEPAHSMYFVAAGEVEIELPKERIRLGVGHFFGEIAVLRRARRSANVIAIERTSLLVLDGRDLHMLMEQDSRLTQRINEVVRSRVGHELVSAKGDIVTEELDEDAKPPDDPQP